MFQNAYYTELGANPAKLMPPDFLHDWELGVGRGTIQHNLRILHAIGGGAINLFDARWVQVHALSSPARDPFDAGFAKSPLLAVTPFGSLEGVSLQ